MIWHGRRDGVSLVVGGGEEGTSLPQILYWGADLGELDGPALAALEIAHRAAPGGSPTEGVHDLSVLPAYERGWTGRAGLIGSRSGRSWSPAFRTSTWTAEPTRLVGAAVDEAAALAVTIEIELVEGGLIRLRAELENQGGDPYRLDALRLALPVPDTADEVLDLTGRWSMERVPQRRPFTVGAHLRENFTGRTGLGAAYLVAAGRAGFGFRSGPVWAVHLGWSGDQEIYAERTASGGRVLAAGEAFHPGEIVLAPGERHTSPWVYGSWGEGLDRVAERFHRHLRALPSHPRAERPVVVNTWEAVYFDHDLSKLTALAEAAAAVGAERFVVDDGWFGSRRDDTSGLGDWTVSEDAWPAGLGPLIGRVRALGMDFGIWVEPEMVNLDSDLARAHPEWIMAVDGRIGPPSRHQHVLDLTHPGAYRHVETQLSTLLRDHEIAYLKWDHNRLLTEAGHTPGGEPVTHAQTLAVYRMMDQLREAHPGLEIESCASGGGRIDLGVLEHTQRVWGSDCNDPVERTEINRHTQLLVPPELIGAHIGPSPSHTTGRDHPLAFRAAAAVWCHLGFEEDLTRLDASDVEALTRWIAFHKANRSLLHTGTVVNGDTANPEVVVHGVVAPDLARALFSVTLLARPLTWPPGLLTFPGLAPERRYRARLTGPEAPQAGRDGTPAWARCGQTVLTGRMLAEHGLAGMPIWPERAYFVEFEAAD
jgi:alpha-galactosidase